MPFSREIRDQIHEEQGDKCLICDKPIQGCHHIVPEALGGLSIRELGIGACEDCHPVLDRLVFEDGITPLGPLTELPDQFFRSGINPFKGVEIEYGKMRQTFIGIAKRNKGKRK